MRKLLFIALLMQLLFSSCWPTRVGFVDGSMPPEWQQFSLKTLENNAPNAPLSYAANLSESIKDGIQNNTRLALVGDPKKAQVQIEGEITNYSITPIALQEGDNAAQNRLTISVKFDVFITAPEEDKMTLVSNRYVDYSSTQDLSSVEATLLEEINSQIVQDVINKLLSNW